MTTDTTAPLQSLIQLRAYISARRKWQLMALTAATICGAALEIIVLGSLVPFIAIITGLDPTGDGQLRFGATTIPNHSWIPRSAVSWAAVFCGAVVFSALFRVQLSLAIYRFSFGLGHELSVSMYRNTLYQPYSYHTQSHSSELLAGINKCNASIFNVLLPLLNMATAAAMSVAIIVGLLLIDWKTAVTAALVFGVIYSMILGLTQSRMRKNSRIIASTQTSRIKSLQEGVGGIRDILLDHSQAVFLGEFARRDQELRRAQISSSFLGSAPKFLIEAIGMVLIAALALFYVSTPSSGIGSVAVLSAMALGAQRLLPQLQLVYYGWASLRSHHSGLVDVIEFLERRIPAEYIEGEVPKALTFNDQIELRNVRFRYASADRDALRGADLTIKKGARIGIVGKTGSGKSTLVDVLMGLQTPSHGEMLIDGSSLEKESVLGWRSSVAHVPQQIHLSDASVADNIAFGKSGNAFDMQRVRAAAEKAQIADVIEAMPDGYMTVIGERGVRLSGGQRQRLGLARAFYRAPALLFLDEATSALDNETERLVMDAVFSQDDKLTVIMVAHRISTLDRCDIVYEIVDGKCVTYTGLRSSEAQA